jgi:HSP20 family protein
MMRGLMPWMGTMSLKNEIDRLFDRLAELKGNEPLALGDWAPSMDVSETKDSLIAKLEVPRTDPRDIQISLQGQPGLPALMPGRS